ncbi:MAG: hypothetical protein A49_29460 [Methyloceanibacter sp.]|nr:MAG: hypothetical protein A49_29460 [Methyloceanibacter sp.]
MPEEFQLQIPTADGTTVVALKVGDILYVLGANGTGKSSLVSRFFNGNRQHARRISAHRQTWFESNALDMTPRAREQLEDNMRAQDAHPKSRYWEWNPGGRSSMAIFDLIDADTMQERSIAAAVRAGDMTRAQEEAQDPSPIETINDIMRLSNLPIEIGLDDGQKVVARKNDSPTYSVAELSDGERNAFLLAASVLTAEPGTLILVDEPERHLHRSIIAPLLKLLFDKRKDCAFVVSTHELTLPLETPEASTLLVRDCVYVGAQVTAWTVDLLDRGASLDEGLKRDVLGARRKILFVEGTAQSLDVPLYGLLFPYVSVIPKGGCKEVEHAVKGLRGSLDMHWVAAWGIVDNDQRSAEEIKSLRDAGVWALDHYSVESLYFHPSILMRVAERQANLTGDEAEVLVASAIEVAVKAANDQKEHLVTTAVLRSVRRSIFGALPKKDEIENEDTFGVEIDIASCRDNESERFDALVAAKDWDGLLTRYALRESAAFDRVISGIKIADQATYRSAVLKLLQDDPAAVQELLDLLGDLPAQMVN